MIVSEDIDIYFIILKHMSLDSNGIWWDGLRVKF